jgi:uncharacterized SAM-binding protein YcdF (DUF218 family)
MQVFSRPAGPRARRAVLLLSLVVAFGLCVYLAPRYLAFSEKPEKSDAVILLIGSNYRARLNEASQLVREGYAKYLIVPAHNRVLEAGSDGSLIRITPPPVPALAPQKTTDMVEDTHVEIASAKHVMESLGLKSGIFVSSPYHMRRIKVIAERVYRDATGATTYRLYFVPSRYETPDMNTWFMSLHELKFVLMEYGKLFWFLIYSNFHGGPWL